MITLYPSTFICTQKFLTGQTKVPEIVSVIPSLPVSMIHKDLAKLKTSVLAALLSSSVAMNYGKSCICENKTHVICFLSLGTHMCASQFIALVFLFFPSLCSWALPFLPLELSALLQYIWNQSLPESGRRDEHWSSERTGAGSLCIALIGRVRSLTYHPYLLVHSSR